MKSWIDQLSVYEPGRPIEEVARELGFDDINSIIKVASNENEFGPSPKSILAMQNAVVDMHRYPDGGAFYLKEKLSSQLDISPDQILFGNGSNELIIFLAHLYLEPSKSLVMSEHAFAVYALATRLYQGELIQVPMNALTHDLEAILDAIQADTQIVAIVNPNNPTGTAVDRMKLVEFIHQVPDNVLCVIDEAYLEVMPKDQQPDLLPVIKSGKDNLLILRTFSKGYGLAGLRIGYGIGSKKLIEQLNRVRQPFNVNKMAQVAALAALDDQEYIESCRSKIIDGVKFLELELQKLGLETIPSSSNFLLVKTGNGREIFEKLKRKKVIVRPMDVYGLDDFVRITVGTKKQNQLIVNVFSEFF
ncbi:MAG: histidinol-phosphate transaminase [Pontiellaceae bacterium]